jgi:carbon storage regulator CsrA
MLVLSRYERESIFIGEGPDRIEVYVAEIKKGRVRLGIEAPAEMWISRSGGPSLKADDPNDGYCDE